MNQLDQLIKQFQGADYFQDPEETKWRLCDVFLPIILGGFAILGGVGYWIYEALL